MLADLIASMQIMAAKIANPLPDVSTDQDRISLIANTTFAIVGAVAVLVITVAGLRYVLSHGDPNLIAQSKKAIIYALVGLVVTISAYGIVTFVVSGL